MGFFDGRRDRVDAFREGEHRVLTELFHASVDQVTSLIRHGFRLGTTRTWSDSARCAPFASRPAVGEPMLFAGVGAFSRWATGVTFAVFPAPACGWCTAGCPAGCTGEPWCVAFGGGGPARATGATRRLASPTTREVRIATVTRSHHTRSARAKMSGPRMGASASVERRPERIGGERR